MLTEDQVRLRLERVMDDAGGLVGMARLVDLLEEVLPDLVASVRERHRPESQARESQTARYRGDGMWEM